MPMPDVSTNESIAEYADKELELMLDDFVLAMGFFWVMQPQSLLAQLMMIPCVVG